MLFLLEDLFPRSEFFKPVQREKSLLLKGGALLLGIIIRKEWSLSTGDMGSGGVSLRLWQWLLYCLMSEWSPVPGPGYHSQSIK